MNTINPTPLLQILTYKRGHNTESEKQFCADYFGDFESFKNSKGEVMAYVYKMDDTPVLWSCHVDTVHSDSGSVPVLYDPAMMVAYTDGTTQLGADDGAGVWLLKEMIAAGVPGTYIFHRGEEKGGIGSQYLADNHILFLSKFNYAIAFDRRHDSSVITHQGSRGCSNEFAIALAESLNTHGLTLQLDDTGVFTDTALYFGIISECTNVSCGYQGEHTYAETLDVEYVFRLRDALIAAFHVGVDLPAVRTPSKDTWGSRSGYSPFMRDVDDRFDTYAGEGLELSDLAEMSLAQIKDFCYDCPDRAGEILHEAISVLLFQPA